MAKISTYPLDGDPKLSDKLIGTSSGYSEDGELLNPTYNFSLQQLLDLFLPVIPSNNLQGVLDYGNTATQNINLFGKITNTNLEVTNIATLFSAYISDSIYIEGQFFDKNNSKGTLGQILRSTGDGVEWITPIVNIPTLEQVLGSGNIADINIILNADLSAEGIEADTVLIQNSFQLNGSFIDSNGLTGTSGQMLVSLGSSGVLWQNVPVYTASSPLFINPATKNISIQQANSTQNGYLSYIDWINFDGKQNALSGTGIVVSNGGTITYITNNSANWNQAYNDSIVSAAVTGTTTKTLTLTQRDGDVITTTWTESGGGGSLSSVGLSMPAAFIVVNSPLTSNGTIQVQAAGTALQYIKGDGTLGTLPSVAGFVPYTGATQDVDLGTNDITANAIIKSGGTSSQFLKADGSIDSNSYITNAALAPYLLSSVAASTYYPIPTGTTSQYVRGDGSLAAFPSIPSVTPSALTKVDDVNVTLSLGGSPNNALLQNVSLTLGWVGTLADSRIASASIWNAKQNAISLTTVGTSGPATFIGNVLNIPQYQDTTYSFNAPLQLLPGNSVEITQAGSSQDGYLSSTDWNIFNSKANGFSLPQYDIPMVDATGSALTSSGAKISSNSFDFVQSGSSLPFGASNLLARDANFIIGVYNGNSSSLVIKNWDGSFGNYEAIEFASIGTAMSYTSVTNQWTIANGITFSPIMGTFNVYSFEINAISGLVTYGGRQLFQDYTNPGINGAVVPMVGTLGLVNSGLEVLSLGSLYLSFYSGAGNLPTAVGELQVSNSITRINIFDASGNVLDLRNYDSSNIVNITALGSYLLAGYDPSMGAYSYAGNYISYNQAMAQFKVTYFGGDVFVADWNSQTGVLFGKQIPVLNNPTYFGGDIPYVTAFGELTASGLSYNAAGGGMLYYYGGQTFLPPGVAAFHSSFAAFTVNNAVSGSGSQLILNNHSYPFTGVNSAIAGDMIWNDAVMAQWGAFGGAILYSYIGSVPTMYFASTNFNSTIDRYSFQINGSNIWSSLSQNYISVNSSYLPDNSPIVNANAITMLGVYDSNDGQYNPSYYAQRNLNVGSYSNSLVLVLGNKNSCVDFTLKIRVTNSNKFFTINGYVSVDWDNSLYTFKVTSSNTSNKDDSETKNINMDFEFSGGLFLIKLDNSSGGNDLYVNINANIS